MVRDRRVHLAGTLCLDPMRRLKTGQRVEVALAEVPSARPPRPREAVPSPIIRHADDQIVVVDKPAGLTTMRHPEEAAEFGDRGRRYLPPTLADLLPKLLGRGPRLRAVHRIDKETSGLVVFARSAEAERHLGRQFREHTIERRYLALVRGRAVAGRIDSPIVRDRGDGRRGRGAPGEGQHAVTHVRVLEELGKFTFLECQLETGRTHQVRIHLGEAGTPLCGERIYDRPLHGRPVPDGSGAQRILLHAAFLGFDHPGTSLRVDWTSPLPTDMATLLQTLRKQA